MDPTVIVIVIVVLMPVAVFWALAKSASLRGPMARPESRRAVEALVTDVLPEEHPEEDDEVDVDTEPTPGAGREPRV
ncbi:MAG: hypothetical protein ACJ76Z_10390 [Thermoleophilaceae bacterium]